MACVEGVGVFAEYLMSGGSRRWASRRCGALAQLPAWERLMEEEDKDQSREGVERLRASGQRGG